MFDLPFELEPVCSVSLPVIRRDVVGVTPQGLRSAGYLGEGKVEGARLNGMVLAGGADWACLRSDGVMDADVKFMIRTDDDALIQVYYTGVVDFGERGYENVVKGLASSDVPRPRVAPRMLTQAPRYLWVNRSQFIGIGEIVYGEGTASVRYNIHRLI